MIHAPGARSATSTAAGIVRSAKQIPPADGEEDESGAFQRVVQIGRGAERHAVAVLGGLALQHLGHALQSLSVDVVQHDLVERAAL